MVKEVIMPEIDYNIQYRDLMGKLLKGQPRQGIDPLTQALLSASGGPAFQTTNLPQTNRLGQALSDFSKTVAGATKEQDTTQRLWDAEKINLLHYIFQNDTAAKKAAAEAEQQVFENKIKQAEELRKQGEEGRKAGEGVAVSDYFRGTIGDISPTIKNLQLMDSGQGFPQVPIKDLEDV